MEPTALTSSLNLAFTIAAGLSLLIACVHTFMGGKSDLRPLLQSDIPEPAKSTLYYCWHVVTIVLFAMTGLFAWSALIPENAMPAMVATGLSIAFSIWGFLIAGIRKRSLVSELPQGLMFAILAGVGLFGIDGATGDATAEREMQVETELVILLTEQDDVLNSEPHILHSLPEMRTEYDELKRRRESGDSTVTKKTLAEFRSYLERCEKKVEHLQALRKRMQAISEKAPELFRRVEPSHYISRASRNSLDPFR